MMGSFMMRKLLQVIVVLWLHEYIDCQCVIPEFNFPNGEVLLPPLEAENGTKAENSSVIQFICFEGYLRMGVEYIQCVSNDTSGTTYWTDSEPFCAGMHCRDPPVVENANYSIISVAGHLEIGSTVLYKCDEGYELQNVSVSKLSCVLDTKSDTAKWEGEHPLCKIAENVSCLDPGESKHGGRTGACCNPGDTLDFNCSAGYTLVGNQTITCLRSGLWTSDRPLCRPPLGYCELPTIPHGVLIPADVQKNKYGDYIMISQWAEVKCKPGYKYVGNASKCLAEKGWPPKGVWKRPFGTCEEFVCKAPPPLLNGTIPEIETSNSTIFPENFEITYVCDKGFKIYSGDSRRKCVRRGWSGTAPRCEVVKCPDPGSPENGNKIGNDYSMGATVRFECNGKFYLVGSYERQCQPNGQWSGMLSRCNIESNYCEDPGFPINGRKNMTSYEMGDRVGFECSPRYMLIGSKVRECLPNRTWSGEEARCLSYYDYDDQMKVSEMLKTEVAKKAEEQKKELDVYSNSIGSLTKRRIYSYGNSMDLNYPGRIILYFAFDVSGSIQAGNLRKSIEFAKAIVRKVGISEHGARAGALTFSSQADIIFFPMQFSTTEQVVDAMDKINFTGGGTSANSALKAIREQHLPLVREWIPKTNTKSVLFILTDGKANMDGDPKLEANRLKAKGVEIFCIGITGDINQKLLFDIASKSKYGRNQEERYNVFILQNYKTLAWLVHEITNGTIDYSQCGLGADKVGIQNVGNIMDGEISKEAWPWMAVLLVNDEAIPPFHYHCGGSVIHPRFILTAAHCLYKGSKKMDRTELLVKTGLTDIRTEIKKHEYDVRKIIIHPMYIHGQEIYDNDIALLELKQPIEFDSEIRPICLPPKDKADLYLTDSIVWATGFGEEGYRPVDGLQGQTTRFLKEISLPIQDREKCLQSLRDLPSPTYFTPRMFCAGTGTEGHDICKGDSGGPVMKSILNEDGYLAWTQVGIISWGPGCGVESQYAYQTKLQDFRQWIDEEIEKALKLLTP